MDPINPMASAPDIPDLKKEETERRGAAVPFLGAGRAAAALSGFFGHSSLLGVLFASSAGPALVLGCFLAAGLAAAGAGLSLISRVGGTPGGAAGSGLALDGAGNSGLKIRGSANTSLFYLNQANKGRVTIDSGEVQPVPPRQAPEKSRPENLANAAGGVDAARAAGAAQGRFGQLTGNTDGLGANSQAGWGSGRTRLKPAGDFQMASNFMGDVGNRTPQLNSNLNKLNRMGSLRPFSGTQRSFSKSKMSSAMGQLRLSQKMSVAGANSVAEEQGKTYSADAFDQGRTHAGAISGLPQIGSGIVAAPGSIAPAPNPGSTPVSASYQNPLNQATSLAQSASQNKLAGIAMVAAALLAIAAALAMWAGWVWVGAAALAAALAALLAGFMMQAKAQQQGAQAAQIGRQLQQQSGQTAQGQIVKDCAAQAAANGTDPSVCAQQNASSQQLKTQQDQQNSQMQQLQQQRLRQQQQDDRMLQRLDNTSSVDGNGAPIGR